MLPKALLRVGLKHWKLLTLLVLLAVTSVFAGSRAQGLWADLFMDLGANFIAVIGTVFIFDRILQKQRENDYLEVYRGSQEQISKLCNMLITYLREPFGFKFPIEKVQNWSNLAQEAEVINRSLSKKVIQEIGEKVRGTGVEGWIRFRGNILLLRMKMSQVLSLHKEAVPPLVLGKLLALHIAFEGLDTSFGLFEEFFTEKPEKWPANRHGASRNLELRELQLDAIVRGIQHVLRSTNSLFSALDSWREDLPPAHSEGRQ